MRFSEKIIVLSSMDVLSLIHLNTSLSKTKIKDAMEKGAVILQRQGAKRIRLRKGRKILQVNDVIHINYDDELLNSIVPTPQMLLQNNDFSIWFKPRNLLSQGTSYGDHCSLLRLVEKHFISSRQKIKLIHRLDREAQGLLIFAHSKNAAAQLSQMLTNNQITKHYKVFIAGKIPFQQCPIIIDSPLDNKNSQTDILASCYDEKSNTTLLKVVIKTGRLHQIRRHLASIGMPVIGDKRYGKPHTTGLQLECNSIRFTWKGSENSSIYVDVPEDLSLTRVAPQPPLVSSPSL